MAGGCIEAAIGGAVGKLIEHLMDPLKKQVNYLCCYSCNVQGLADEVQELNVKYETVQEGVRAARANLQRVCNTAEVNSWLAKVEGVKTESDRIRDVTKEVQGKCLCKWLPVMHYCLSREAGKKTKTATDLRKNPPVPVFTPLIPAEMDPVPDTSRIEFTSRNSIEKEIVDSLKDEQVYLIGIQGPGGVGKTTMAKKIAETVRAQNIFVHVVMAVVSQQPDPQKIQREIAGALGLQLNEQDNPINGAKKLYKRLLDENSILIILDDVWDRLDLDKLGIPPQRIHGGCKLLLTSRNQGVFTLPSDHVSKIFPLQILGPEESWVLFKAKAGIQDNFPDDLIQIVEDVVKECKGLPLALTTVGLALRGESKSSWENALGELQKSMPMNILNVIEDVYKPLMYSIKQLKSEEARYLFLLCCLFPEDYDISFEELARCIMALPIFKGLESLKVARNRVETLTRILISRSLLIESNDSKVNPCVKMHDVIRDVGIWIASEEKIGFEGEIVSKEKQVFMISHGKKEWPIIEEDDSYHNYTCISLIFLEKRDIDIPKCINCPRLEFLWLEALGDYPLNLPKTFFSGMKRLRYLYASNFGSLPSSIGLLNNLRTLHLKNCEIVGQSDPDIHEQYLFDHLQIAGNFDGLRSLVLEFIGFKCLFPPTMFGGLSNLEELVLRNCYNLEEAIANDKKVEETTLFQKLKKLHLLTLPKILTFWCGTKELPSLEELHIEDCPRMESFSKGLSHCSKSSLPFLSKEIAGNFDRLSSLILKDINCKCLFSSTMLRALSNLEELKLSDCSMLEEVIEYDKNVGETTQFPKLKKLSLFRLPNILTFWCGAIKFPSLEELGIDDCPLMERFSKKLSDASNSSLSFFSEEIAGNFDRLSSLILQNINCKCLFPSTMSRDLSNLEKLVLRNCSMLEEVIGYDKNVRETTRLPKLKKLFLYSLPKILIFWYGAIECPSLEELDIEDCPLIERFSKKLSDASNSSLPFFSEEIAGNFDGLSNLILHEINCKCLFPSTMSIDLSNLEKLRLRNCSMLEEVIGYDKNVGEITRFPKLKILSLYSLQKILTFWYGAIEFPSLEELDIENCPLMERFSKKLSDASNSSLPFFSEEITRNFDGLSSLILQDINCKCLFPSTMSSGLSNLKQFELRNCSRLEEVIGYDKNVGETTWFPKLKYLNLWSLPKLLTFWYGAIEFPSIEDLLITGCPLMERISKKLSDASNSSLPFFNEEVYSPKLKCLKLEGLHNIARIFSLPSFKALTNLKTLFVYGCEKLEEVIIDEEEIDRPTNIKEILSPQLELLRLDGLPMINRVCHTKRSLEFPSLKIVMIGNCPKLERFSLGTLHLPTITSIDMDRLPDADFANRFFYNKEISFDQIHLEKDCFFISVKQMSIKGIDNGKLLVIPDSSENFIDAIAINGRMVEITRTFEITMLLPGVVYEIIFMIMLNKNAVGWDKGVEFELELLGEVTQHQVKTLSEQPRGRWIHLLVRKFTREHHQTNLEFSLFQRDEETLKWGLYIRGVKFIKSLEC